VSTGSTSTRSANVAIENSAAVFLSAAKAMLGFDTIDELSA
jgi:hypothetical protein